MGIEIERKFLLADTSILETAQGIRCRQGYIFSDRSKTVRVRTMDHQGYLTIKGPAKGIAKLEFEYEIPLNEAEELLDALCQKPLIEKNRYKIPFEGFVWEVDLFFGQNEGLVIAEIELEDEEQHFPKPGWIGQEVTGDSRYYNASLATNPFTAWHHFSKTKSTDSSQPPLP